VDRCSSAQIDVSKTSRETRVHRAAPRIAETVEFNGTCTISHVPEIGMAPFELRLRPGKHDAVLMVVIARIVIRHDPSRRRIHRMHVSGSLEGILDTGFRQFPL